jgi:hypothetical protein
MSSSAKTMCVIDLRQKVVMRVPTAQNSKPADRATTVFSMDDVDGTLTLIGTYDQLLDFAADIGKMAMSWTLVTGHSNWLGDDIQAMTREVASNDGHENWDGSEAGNGGQSAR